MGEYKGFNTGFQGVEDCGLSWNLLECLGFRDSGFRD